MRALVTGGAGLIGSHIVDRLLARGWDVRILDSLELPTHLKGKPSWVPPEAEFIQDRTENREALGKALQGVDVVFHEAAYQGFLPSFSKFWEVNGGGTALIYELIVEKKLDVSKVVIASSQAVYGESKYRCATHGDMIPGPRSEDQLRRQDWEQRCPQCDSALVPVPTDESMIDPRSMYAQTKRAQETIGLELGRMYDIPTVALRYAITQGPRQSIYHAYSGVCSIFATRILNDLPPIVYEDGQQLRDYIYVGDVVDANLLVMESSEERHSAGP
jgi:dTDP-L-rhamnose 4-epimerase